MKEKLKKLSDEASEKLIALFSSDEFKSLVEVTKAAGESGSFSMVISSEHLDRQGEVVMQDGIDTGNYMKNPVVLNSHDYYGIDNIVAMTTSLSLQVVGGVKCTVATGNFAPTESGQLARKLYEGGFLNAGSIGFIAKAFDAKNDCIITASEMLEWSFCSVPANAAALRLNALGVTADQLRSKGFQIDEVTEEKKAAGDPCMCDDGTEGVMDDSGMCVPKAQKAIGDMCEMADGSEGTMEDDGNGGMICKPKAKEGEDEKSIREYYEKAERKEKDAQQVGAILAELQNVLDNALVAASRLILDIMQTEFGQSVAGKSEIAAALKEKNYFETIKTSIAAFEQKLGSVKGEERSDGSAPEERSQDVGFAETMKNVDDFLMARQVLRAIATSVSESLEKMNRKESDRRKARGK